MRHSQRFVEVTGGTLLRHVVVRVNLFRYLEGTRCVINIAHVSIHKLDSRGSLQATDTQDDTDGGALSRIREGEGGIELSRHSYQSILCHKVKRIGNLSTIAALVCLPFVSQTAHNFLLGKA